MSLIGYAAYSDFRDRGLAALRRDEDGNLSFDRGLRSKGDRRLRVRILYQGQPIASDIRASDGETEEDSVEKEILKARNSLFDEELHHELDREARNLVNQGVRCIHGSILLPYETGKQIEITLVSHDDEASGDVASSDPVADAIAVALRILLSHAHRQNLQNRSKMPLLLREHKPPRSIYALIKPILEYLQHRSYVESIQTFLDAIERTLTAAGLYLSIGTTISSGNRGLVAFAVKHSQNSAVDDVLRTMTLPLDTIFGFAFPPEPTTITIRAHTTLQPPHLGTSFYVTIENPTPDTPMSTLPPHTQLTTLPTLENHIIHLMNIFIIQSLVSNFPIWRTISAFDKLVVRNDPKTRDRETVSVNLNKAQLDLTYLREGKQKGTANWTWYGDQLVSMEKGLVEVFGSLGGNQGGAA